MKTTSWTRFTVLSLLAFTLTAFTVAPSSDFAETLEFGGVEEQAREFIRYERSIRLDSEQEAVKREALEALPAPCCSDNSAYTCCCPCNLSRTIWGMAAFLITEKDADADTVRTKTEEWIEYVNPDGFSGNSCYSGGCVRPFADNGCGGMSPSQLVF